MPRSQLSNIATTVQLRQASNYVAFLRGGNGVGSRIDQRRGDWDTRWRRRCPFLPLSFREASRRGIVTVRARTVCRPHGAVCAGAGVRLRRTPAKLLVTIVMKRITGNQFHGNLKLPVLGQPTIGKARSW
jgi:hypothetical protein